MFQVGPNEGFHKTWLQALAPLAAIQGATNGPSLGNFDPASQVQVSQCGGTVAVMAAIATATTPIN